MVINIIDREFNFLGQIDNYEAFILNKKWHSIGEFELHLHVDTTHAEQLQKENIIFTTERKAYVILYRELNSTNGKLVVKGLEIKSYLARWLVFPPTGQAYYRINSNVEKIMKEYVQATLNRKGIANFIVAPNQNRGIKTVYQSRYKNLADELEKLSLASGLGWDIVLDLGNKQFVFEVYEGQDRTASQNILPPAIFSIEYDNIAEQTLIDSRLNYANTAIVAGQGEGVDRKIEIVGDIDKGLDSFEIFVDARDIENEEELPVRGGQKLAEVQEVFTFDSRVSADKNLIYEEDFELGDIVTIQNKKWNATADRRITKVTEIYEKDGFKLDITFGESIPTIKDVIKQATDVPIVEGGSQGEPGKDGKDGVGLQFTWDGTYLGIKREDEIEYQFVDLQGPKGEQGEQGTSGKSLEFNWNGTQLGVRVEGQTQYQYVDLKGVQGERGPRGFSLEYDWQGTQLGIKREDESNYQYVDLRGPKGDKGDKGDQGLPGADGKSIEFTWSGTQLGVRQEGQSQYQFVDLKGDKGDKGDTGERGPQGIQGPSGKSLEFTWNGTSLGVRQEGQSSYQYVNLKGEKGDKGDKGEKGDKGDKPKHRWISRTQIQFENPDGTWGDAVDLDPQAVLIHQEHFNATDGQEIFNLTKGAYRVGTNSISWYLNGIKQSNDALEELSPTSVRIIGGVPAGSVIIEYLEFANVAIGLKGEKGDKGERGKNIEYNWNGTQLGVRVEGESNYQYVDLRGPKGDKGDPGSDANVTYENVTNALGYTPVNKAGDTMTGDLKVNGNVVAGTEYIIGYNGTSESLQRYKFKYNGSTGYLELWRYSNDTGWTLCATFPNRNHGGGGLTIEGKQVAYKSDIPSKLSEFTKDINFDERYYTETEIDTKLAGKVDKVSGKGLSTNDFTNVYKNKLDGIEEGANKYIHPDTHPASMIVETSSKQFVSDEEKNKWNNKWDFDEEIIKNIKVKKAIDADTVNGMTVESNVPPNAKFTDTTYSEISTSEIDAGTSSTLRTISGRRVKYILDKVSTMILAAISNLTKADIGLGNVDNVKQATKVEFDTHNNDSTRHITSDERNKWNNKANKSDIPTKVSQLENDKNYVTQEELGDAGFGDMVKAVYDKNNDGKVDKAEIADVANSVTWGNISGKPSTFPPSSHTHNYIVGDDTRNENYAPSEYMSGGSRGYGRAVIQSEFKYISTIGAGNFLKGTYCQLLTYIPWTDSSGGYPIQIALGNGTPCWRVGTGATTWSTWSPMAGTKIVTSPTEPTGLTTGDQWHKEY